jgi:hypothetical protein
MKAYLSLIFTLLLFACTERREKLPEAPVSVTGVELPSAVEQSVADRYPKGLPAVPEFPGQPYYRVIAYELNGRYGDARAATVFHNQTGKQIVLTESQIGEFLSLLNNRKSYGHYEMACFDPHIGLVFYDASEKIVAYLSLCLQCNNVRSEPPLDFDFLVPTNSGFTKKAYRQFFEMFNAWGIPHEHTNTHPVKIE